MQHSESIKALLPALLKVQEKVRTIAYDSKNTFFNAKYASLTVIMETVRPWLTEAGLILTQGTENPVHHDGVLRSLDVTATLLHAASGEWYTVRVTVPIEADPVSKGSDVRMPNPQTLGKAVTYARRYVVSALLALVTDEDTDGNHPERDPRQQTDKASASKPSASKGADIPKRAQPPKFDGSLQAAMTFPYPGKGENHGKPLGEVEVGALSKAVDAAVAAGDEKFADFIARAERVLAFHRGEK